MPEVLINFISQGKNKKRGDKAMGDGRSETRGQGEGRQGEGRWAMRRIWDFGIDEVRFGASNLVFGFWFLELGTWALKFPTPPTTPNPSNTHLPGEKYSQGDQPAATDAG